MKTWCIAWFARDPATRAITSTVWCAANVPHRPAAAAVSIPTKCEHWVMLPIGVARREPSCPDCRRALALQPLENPDDRRVSA